MNPDGADRPDARPESDGRAERTERREHPPREWYRLGNPLRFAVNLYVCEVCKLLPVEAKNAVYRLLGADVGAGTVIAPHVQVDPFFPGKLTVGEGSLIGWGTKLLTHEADTDGWLVGPLDIGDDVTVGHGCSTRPGVTIGDGATVAAHSFVNRDVPAGATVGGVPIEPL